MHSRPGLLLPGWAVAVFVTGLLAGPLTSAVAAERPRVGLVLAGGGAKGGAHVGVLKVLEELHVPVDCIAGTSMGALIGGGYASGIPAAGLQDFVAGIDWKLVVGNQGTRELEPIEQKRAGATYSNDFELGITKDGIVSPAGLVNTSNIDDLLRTYVAGARLETSFDELPIPYRAVATDMVQSRMVVLDSGDLATAMRASMAIPGAFAPVLMDDMILSDGGLVRNIPVDVARNLCGDVVIVVNLVEPAADPNRLRSATQLLSRTMDVMIEANENLQLASLRPDDIRIDVHMGDITTADFERVPDTIPLGEAAARAKAAELSKYAVPPQQYQAWRQSVTASQQIEARLADVRFEGLKRVNPEYLAAIDTVKAGDVVDTSVISKEAQRLAALQDLDSVGYRLDGDPKEPTLTWLPREKTWGPNYLKADLGAYTSLDGDLTFTLYARHVRTWLNKLGGEWRNEFQIGSDSLISTSLFQPLDMPHRYFVEPRLYYSQSSEDVFLDGERISRYKFRDLAAAMEAGVNIGTYAQARVGYLYDSREVIVDIGSPLMPEIDPVDAGVTVSLQYDSRDTGFNPGRGIAAAIEYIKSDDSMGGDRSWERAEMGVGLAVPFRRDIMWVTLAGGTDLNDNLPADRAFALGGANSFPGLELGELRVNSYWTAGTSYMWNVKELMSLRNHALYFGGRLVVGGVYDRIDGGRTGELLGGSLFLTGRTFFGPMTLGVGGTTTDSWSAWLSIGRPAGHGTILERGIFR